MRRRYIKIMENTKIGVEQEFVFKDAEDVYLDFSTARYSVFSDIVDAFPYYEGDVAVFECKSLERRPKRLYVEGFERYDLEGKLIQTTPKGLEIRTTPHCAIELLIDEFAISYHTMKTLVASHGLSPLLTSHHPYRMAVEFAEPLNAMERRLRTEQQLNIARNAMLAHGLHINISVRGWTRERMTDLVRKLNYYLPYIIPFSFSSPFSEGGLFKGLSRRNYERAARRQLVQLQERNGEAVVQFRGFDACGDRYLLAAIVALFKGVVLSDALSGRAATQDADAIRQAALHGFANDEVRSIAKIALNSAHAALCSSKDLFDPLKDMLRSNDSYAARMKTAYARSGNIMDSMSDMYRF